uniref:Uncharacterized protein n=1 Tax=Equus asinus TaxID=9793 RepID=A0A8C4PTM8_EQUAS
MRGRLGLRPWHLHLHHRERVGPGVRQPGPEAPGPVHLHGWGPGGVLRLRPPLLLVGAEAASLLVQPADGRGQHQHHLCPQLPRLLRPPIFECLWAGWHHPDLSNTHGRVDHYPQEGCHPDDLGMHLQLGSDSPGWPGLLPAGLANPPAGRVSAHVCHLPDILVAARVCPVADYHGQTRPSASGTQKGGQDKWPQGSQKDTDHRGADVQHGGGGGLREGPPVGAGPVPRARAVLEKLESLRVVQYAIPVILPGDGAGEGGGPMGK